MDETNPGKSQNQLSFGIIGRCKTNLGKSYYQLSLAKSGGVRNSLGCFKPLLALPQKKRALHLCRI